MKDRSHFPAVSLFRNNRETKTPTWNIHRDRLVMTEWAYKRWMDCVFDSKLSANTKHILIAISALSEKYFFVGVNITLRELEAATSLSNPTVIKHIKIAKESNFLYTEKDENNSVYYTIIFQDNNGGR